MAERAIDEVGGDGGASLVTEPTLAEIKEAASQVATEAKQLIETCRSATDTTRFCKWDGQSPDGLKHKAYNSEEEPEPFEGASDMRVRTADMLINEDVVLLVTAAMRAQLNFKGTESNDSAQAGKMAILMRWVIRNYWGTRWIKELLKLANYYVGDSPALALLGVYWRQETALKTEQLTAQKLMDMYLQNVMEVLVEQTEASGTDDLMAQAEQAASDFMVALNDKEFGEEILAAKLIEYFPGIRRARAKKVIRELRERGQAEFPVPYMRKNGPEVSAKRFLEDWFIPINTAEFQDARIYFEAEWLSKPEIIERKISEDWSDKFIEQVIGKPDSAGKRVGGHEGSAAFPDYVHGTDGVLRARTAEEYKGLYQILTAYYKATNEDGVPGRYYVVFHADADVAATERKLIDYAHGGYPGHAFQREVLTSRLCDTRGLAELAGPYQGLMKVYCDSFGDHAQIAGVPPIITRNRQRLGALHIRPLVELQAKRDGDYAWMKPPEYPRTVIDMIKELRRQTDEYFGRTNPEVAQDVVQLQREFKVLWWLMNLREALGQVWKLCQQYMPNEMIARITNAQGEPLFKSREEIQGQFDLELQFDPRDLDPEYLKTVAGIVKDILLAMDRDKTIRTAPIVSALLWRLAPELADASLVNVDEAAAEEREAEIEAYQQIRAGTEPELPDDGSINYEVRLALYQEMQQMNPAIFQDMAEDKMLILESRLQRMQVLAQQYGANVEIGRQGGRRALSVGAGSGGAGNGSPGGLAPPMRGAGSGEN